MYLTIKMENSPKIMVLYKYHNITITSVPSLNRQEKVKNSFMKQLDIWTSAHVFLVVEIK